LHEPAAILLKKLVLDYLTWLKEKGSIPDQAPLKAMDDYHLLFSLRPSEQLFLLFLNQLHLIWEGGPVSVLKVVPEKG
jgi:hypothetical protein